MAEQRAASITNAMRDRVAEAAGEVLLGGCGWVGEKVGCLFGPLPQRPRHLPQGPTLHPNLTHPSTDAHAHTPPHTR
jgi:hypothetical protein